MTRAVAALECSLRLSRRDLSAQAVAAIRTAAAVSVLTRLLLGAVVVASLGGCATAPPRVDLLIRNVTIHAGTDDAPPGTGSVGVRDGAFVFVEREPLGTTAADVIDGTGLHLMPGLWDMHAHVRASASRAMDVAQFPMHGVTSIRDMGGFRDRIDAVKAQIDAGTMPGPGIHSSYATLNGEAFAPFQRVVRDEAQAIAAIDDAVRSGAVQVKVHRALAPAMLPVIVRIAHARGLKVTGHIPLGVDPLAACELGMDGIEHVGSLLEAHISVTPRATASTAIEYLESAAADPLYRCLDARNVAVTPTLVIYPAVARKRAKGGRLPDDYRDFIAGVGRIALRLHRSGIVLLAGSDAADPADAEAMGIEPGASLLDELQMLQDAGIPAREVLRMATSNAARAIGLEARIGTIEAGKAADFLLLEADPEQTVVNLRRLHAVYRQGRRLFPR